MSRGRAGWAYDGCHRDHVVEHGLRVDELVGLTWSDITLQPRSGKAPSSTPNWRVASGSCWRSKVAEALGVEPTAIAEFRRVIEAECPGAIAA